MFEFERYDFDVPEDRAEAISRYGLPVHPSFALVDRYGNIVERLIGPVSNEELRAKVIALINAP